MLDLLAIIGICFKIGAEGSFRVAAQRKGCFCVLPTGFDKSLIYQLFVYAKSSSSCVQQPTVIVILPCQKRGIGRKHTNFASCKNAACSNELFSLSSRLCFGGKRFEWENVNFGRLVYFILRGPYTRIDFLWSAWFSLWCKSIFFLGPFRNVKLFIAAD